MAQPDPWCVRNPVKCKNSRRASVRKARGAKNPSGELKVGPCEICGDTVTLRYDHDHMTGEFRGWICDACNRALGCMKDSPALLRRAADYLEKKNEQR